MLDVDIHVRTSRYIWAHDVPLHIVGTNEPKSTKQAS